MIRTLRHYACASARVPCMIGSGVTGSLFNEIDRLKGPMAPMGAIFRQIGLSLELVHNLKK